MIDDDQLLHYYERELALLRRSLESFAEQYPRAAARLSISGGQSEDPHVERMMQSFAFLAARISARIDDDYPELAELLLSIIYPQYLRPFPSCSIAQFDIAGMFENRARPVTVPRGTELLTKAGKCYFSTVCDVVLAPLSIENARYLPMPSAPSGVTLPPDTSGMLSIAFSAAVRAGQPNMTLPSTVRMLLAGSREVVTSVMDTMLLRTAAAYVEDSAGRWRRLETVPVAAAGFGTHEGLVPADHASTSFQLLSEYFAFPERFDFIDIDFAALLRAAGDGRNVTLHLAVRDVHPDSWNAHRLMQVSPSHFKLFCTPVVNLFAEANVPLTRERQTGVWPINVERKGSAPTEAWSVDAVRVADGKEIRPLTSLIGGSAGLNDPRWIFIPRNADRWLRGASPAALSLAGADGKSMATDVGQLTVDVTCSNGDLPHSLPVGAPEGDLAMERDAVAEKITLLHTPTPVGSLPRTDGSLWRLISMQVPQPVRLNPKGLDELKEMFRQFAGLSRMPANQIDGVTHLARRSVMQWLVMQPQPGFVRGIEITLTISDQAFAAHSIAVFAGVMERFFTPYAPEYSFVQLVMISGKYGIELWRGKPLMGATPIL
ncbi:type VI secretion system baseplate subunit TssF [Trinickia sp. EG282A]|uniref:type VI secretion system baseplate subunit TssF n=1 Tax=Trinickia sp. EG282A TaxID=3237013 RepID=UPI0034D2DA35